MTGINKFLNIIIILSCAALSYLFYKANESRNTTTSANSKTTNISQAIEQSSIKPNNDPQVLANKYLQQTQQSVTNENLKAEIELKKSLMESSKPEVKKIEETDPTKISRDQEIWKDPYEQMKRQIPLEQRFSNEMNQQATEEMDKQEYIKQFKENARKNGYEITVNDDLEVTSVTPIRKPQNTKNDYDSNHHTDNED